MAPLAGMAPVSRVGGRALAALLPDVRTLPGPVYAALADAVTTLVLDGRVATETRLPSERELAAALQVSRATVTAAYDGLRATGFLASRTGSGSFVTVPAGVQPRSSVARFTHRPGDGPDLIDLSCGTLPAQHEQPPGRRRPGRGRRPAALHRPATATARPGIAGAARGRRRPVHRARRRDDRPSRSSSPAARCTAWTSCCACSSAAATGC